MAELAHGRGAVRVSSEHGWYAADEVSVRVLIDEAEFERMADRAVQRRLRVHSAYVYAQDADQQAQAEAEVEAEVDAELRTRYEVC